MFIYMIGCIISAKLKKAEEEYEKEFEAFCNETEEEDEFDF